MHDPQWQCSSDDLGTCMGDALGTNTKIRPLATKFGEKLEDLKDHHTVFEQTMPTKKQDLASEMNSREAPQIRVYGYFTREPSGFTYSVDLYLGRVLSLEGSETLIQGLEFHSNML